MLYLSDLFYTVKTGQGTLTKPVPLSVTHSYRRHPGRQNGDLSLGTSKAVRVLTLPIVSPAQPVTFSGLEPFNETLNPVEGSSVNSTDPETGSTPVGEGLCRDGSNPVTVEFTQDLLFTLHNQDILRSVKGDE